MPVTNIAIVDLALQLLAKHAYLIVFAATVLENLFVVGSFTPGETITMAGGFVASGGAVNPWLLGVVAVIGSVTGGNISYWIGRKGGRPLIDRYGHRFKMGERRVKAAEGYFHRHGPKTILTARFAPGIKNFAPVLAGASHMSFAVFQMYNFIAALIYVTAIMALGYFFGANFPLLLKIVSRAGWVGLAIAAVVIAWAIWERRRVVAREQARDLAIEQRIEEETGEEHPMVADKPKPAADPDD